MATATTNTILTQIALKRLSGKALTSGKQSLPQEPFGSTVQSSTTTIFGQVVPNTANTGESNLFYIQSASTADPGTVQLVDFDLIPLSNGKYQNVVDDDNDTEESGYNADTGVTEVDTFHAYMLRLTGSYEQDTNAIGASYFADNASTDKVLGTDPEYSDNFIASASVQFQVVPEYLSTEVGSANPYAPTVIASDGSSTIAFTDSSRNMYFDAFAGILFVQDPVDYGTTTEGVAGFEAKSSAATIPATLRAFLYVGKYQSEIAGDDIPTNPDLFFHGNDSGGGFNVDAQTTSSFVSGSGDGLLVSASISNQQITFTLNGVVSGSSQLGSDISGSTNIGISGSNSGFDVGQNGVAKFISGTAGITVLSDGTDTITIGANTDDPEFRNLTGSNLLITNTASISYFHTVFETASIISTSGSTKFGNSSDDKHELTGSLYLTTTGSVDGTSGEFNWKTPQGSTSQIPLVWDSATGNIRTGSSYALSADGMTSFIVSGSSGGFDVTEGNTVKFITGSNGGLTVTAGATDTVTFTLNGVLSSSYQIESDITGAFTAVSNSIAGDINDATASILANENNINNLLTSASSGWYVSASNGGTSIGLTDTASFLGGDGITVSNSSGVITIESDYGELNSPIFLGTGSDAANATGSSIDYNGTASFTSSGAGLSVDVDSSAFTYTITPNTVIEAVDTTTVINITSSYAETASFVTGSDVYGPYGSNSVISASFAVTASYVSSSNIVGDIAPTILNMNTGIHRLIGHNATDTLPGNHELESATNLRYDQAATKLVVGNLSASGAGTTTHELQSNAGTFNLLTANTVNTINVGKSTGTVFFNGSASIAGDLIVQGTTTTLQTANLLVEDSYILLGSSSAANSVGGGIIVQRSSTTSGTALHWDETKDVWALDVGGADASQATAKALDANIAFISHSSGTPGTAFDGPVIVGSEDDYKKGQFYVDTSDDYGLYVYL